MIQVHITELFLKPEIYNSITGKISLFLGGPPAAPLFMAVMGYFLAASSKIFSRKLIRGFQLLGLGLILNIALNANLLISIYSGEFNLNPYEYIFGADILFLAGLSIIATALLEKFFGRKIIYYIILLPIPILIHSILPQSENDIIKYFNALFWGEYSWSYFPFFPWFSYVLAGYVFYLIRNDNLLIKYRMQLNSILIFIAVPFVMFFSYAVNVSSTLHEYYHHEFLFFLWVLGFLLLFVFVADYLEMKIGNQIIMKGIKYLGVNVTAAYVIQWIIIGNISTEIYRTVDLVYGMLSFVGVLVVTYIMIYLYNKSKEHLRNLDKPD